jgi:cytochrome c
VRPASLALAICALTVGGARADGDPVRGEALFSRCLACHAPDAEHSPQGPGLGGVYGRTAAAVPGFPYSDALRRSAIVWDARNLDGYLARPGRWVLGGAMNFMTGNPDDRADIIAYLRTLR